MSRNKENKDTPSTHFAWLNRIIFFQLLGFFIWTVSTPTDPKNAFFLGYSISRWGLILAFAVIAGLVVWSVTQSQKFYALIHNWFNTPKNEFFARALTIFSIFGLWVCLWYPADYFPLLKEEISRIRPFTLSVFLSMVELILFFHWETKQSTLKNRLKAIIKKRSFLLVIAATAITLIAFVFLRQWGLDEPGYDKLTFAPGPALSPFQTLFGLFLFAALFFLFQPLLKKTETRRGWNILVFIIIWGITFAVWTTTPFQCADDRPGPYPPNDMCYPEVKDSVYSIGSHYIRLGEGIYNHWFTEKPMYMLFLAVGQWLLGENIDRYLLFQIGCLSLIPSLLYLIAKKFSDHTGGFLAAYLAILLGVDNILYYGTLGSVNVKMENPELLTSLFILLIALLVFQFNQKERNINYLAAAGGLLGIASLTRINPIFLFPAICILIVIPVKRAWKKAAVNIAVFSLAFSLIFIPGIFSITDDAGHSYYIDKIQDVLNKRYGVQFLHLSEPSDSRLVWANQLMPPRTGVNALGSSLLFQFKMDSTGLSSANDTNQESLTETNPTPGIALQETPQKRSNIEKLFFHFGNNLFLSVTKLPVNMILDPMETIIRQPLWLDDHNLPFWKKGLSAENIMVFSINVFILISGIVWSAKKFGWSGIIPLFLQVSYHIGNGFALTSGERYLEPVISVTLLYYAVGIYAIFIVLSKRKIALKAAPENPASPVVLPVTTNQRNPSRRRNTFLILLACAASGALLALVNLIPSKIETLSAENLQNSVHTLLENETELSANEIDNFLKNPEAIIVEGIAYHPRSYINPFQRWTEEVFELTVLGTEKVYISNLNGNLTPQVFTDESRVILVGCKISDRNFWGAESLLMQTAAIMILDGPDKDAIYLDRYFNFDCQ